MKSYLETLMDYNYWANGLIIKNVEKISPDRFVENFAVFNTSLRGILAHILFAEWVWLERMQGISMAPDEMRNIFRAEKYQDIRQMTLEWFEIELRMRKFMASLGEDDLEKTFKFERRGGRVVENRFMDIFTQLGMHGMQHRSECAVILTEMGHSPGNIDFIVYLGP